VLITRAGVWTVFCWLLFWTRRYSDLCWVVFFFLSGVVPTTFSGLVSDSFFQASVTRRVIFGCSFESDAREITGLSMGVEGVVCLRVSSPIPCNPSPDPLGVILYVFTDLSFKF